jgi:hypothetical protein
VDAGETVKSRPAANRDQNGRAVGGRRFVTDKRLLFRPNRIDSITGGKLGTSDLGQIAGWVCLPLMDGHSRAASEHVFGCRQKTEVSSGSW